MNTKPTLINLADYGTKGVNYYWTRRERYRTTEEELREAGVSDEAAYVDQALVEPLRAANRIFATHGYELIVKDAYRSPELYRLIQRKRNELYGREHTDRLLNMVAMPHSTGRAVDISLIDLASGEEVRMRDPEDDEKGGWFVDYYKGMTDPKSREFQKRQEILISTMLSIGFSLGSKREFWHFEYQIG